MRSIYIYICACISGGTRRYPDWVIGGNEANVCMCESSCLTVYELTRFNTRAGIEGTLREEAKEWETAALHRLQLDQAKDVIRSSALLKFLKYSR